MLTVACVWVKANVAYRVEYVANLRRMVARHLERPHRFVCLTDRPKFLPDGVEPIPIAHDPHLFGWWAKTQLFDPGIVPGDRVLYLDLDSIVVAPLDPIVDYPARFALVPDGGNFKPKTGHRLVKRYNSSVMVWDRGEPPVIQDVAEWAKTYWSDQDAIGLLAPQAAQMPIAWFPRLSEIKHLDGPPADAKVVLCKKPKNEIAADLYPWVGHAWRSA